MGTKKCSNCFFFKEAKGIQLCMCSYSAFMLDVMKSNNYCCCYVNNDDVGEDELLKILKHHNDMLGGSEKNNIQNVEEKVNHPKHYNKNKYECWDEMVAVFGIESVMNFCKCNIWKYRYRNTCEEDLKKSGCLYGKIF